MTDFIAARARMIDLQVRTEDVSDLSVISAMAEVPRERFVTEKAADLAYIDRSVLLKDATAAAPARYLMRPATLAKLLQLAEIAETDKILDVGAATGYSSAVLGRMARSVIALECDEDLARLAAERLSELDVVNAKAVQGALEAGYRAGAPYDVIVLEGAVEFVPQPLFDQLGEGGRLVAVVGSGGAATGDVVYKDRRRHRPPPGLQCQCTAASGL